MNWDEIICHITCSWWDTFFLWHSISSTLFFLCTVLWFLFCCWSETKFKIIVAGDPVILTTIAIDGVTCFIAEATSIGVTTLIVAIATLFAIDISVSAIVLV